MKIFLSDFKSIVNGVSRIFIFLTIDVQLFCCSTVDCLHLHFIVLLGVLVNRARNGNNPMGIP